MLKVNDRVKIIGVNWLKANNYIGKEGVVNTIGMNDSRGGSYVFVKGIKMKSGVKTSWFPESSLEKIEHEKLPSPEKPPEFKVGDEVEIIGEVPTFGNTYVGMKGVIKGLNVCEYPNGFAHAVKFNNSIYDVYASSLKLVKEEPKFKVGDRVRVVEAEGYGNIIGRKGTIKGVETVSKTNFPYMVQLDNGSLLVFSRYALELISEENRVDYPKDDEQKKENSDSFYCCYVEGTGGFAYKHSTEDKAVKEAERLARKENRKVYVLKAIKSCEVPDSPVKWNNL